MIEANNSEYLSKLNLSTTAREHSHVNQVAQITARTVIFRNSVLDSFVTRGHTGCTY